MEKHTPNYSQATAITILLSLLFLTNPVNGVTEQELDAAIASLTWNGYHLFANAISTSDLRYQIIAGNSFTFFAPSDPDVYSLDMESDASDYVQNLRCHVAVQRLATSDLHDLPPLYFINTMIPHHCLLISNNQVSAPNGIFNGSFSVDGVPIIAPDLYTGPSITIHGLEGILALKTPERMNSAFDGIDLGSLSPSFQTNQCFSSSSPSTSPVSVAPAISPATFLEIANSPATFPESASSSFPPSVSASSPAPFSVPANSPDPFSVPANSPAPFSVPASSPASFSVPASSPAPFSISASSPAPFPTLASSPATASTSKENAYESSGKKKREKIHENGQRRKKKDRKEVQDRRRHIDIHDYEEVPLISFYE